MKIFNKNAQQIIEYILFAAVVIAGIVVFVGPSGPFREALEETINVSVEQIGEEATDLCIDAYCLNLVACGDPLYDCTIESNCAACPACAPCCGDGICDPMTESDLTCPTDCVGCSNATTAWCQADATRCATCVNCQPCCGDGNADPGENCFTCPADVSCGALMCDPNSAMCCDCSSQCGVAGCDVCSPCCGDAICNEDPLTCPEDCAVVCGMPTFDCSTPANCLDCAACWPCNGNLICEPSIGETCCTHTDCQPCSCGNSTCDVCPPLADEDQINCAEDCGAHCGNLICDDGSVGPDWGEDCVYCHDDCGWCTWWASPWGPCDRLCYDGTTMPQQCRTVECHNPWTGGVVPDMFCDPATRPPDCQECNTFPCCSYLPGGLIGCQGAAYSEVCDLPDLCGETCASLGFSAAGGVLTCTPDCQGFDTSGCCDTQDVLQCHLGDIWWFDGCNNPEMLYQTCGHNNSDCVGAACVCLAGFDNCDGDWTNGCEIDLMNDNSNCGVCGTVCINATCTGGVCVCNPGFEDCDGDPLNGCEIDLMNDNLNCGVCGYDCSGGICLAGTCYCNPTTVNTTDCDSGIPVPQTEATFPYSDACGITCVGNFVIPCLADGSWGPLDESACGCLAPLADCDGLPGCESDTDTDLLNCGGCGNDCSNGVCIGGLCYCPADTANTTACAVGIPLVQTLVGDTVTPACGSTCAGNISVTCGATGLWGPVDESACGCTPPMADCDLLIPGCETNTDTDLLNCGGCGNDCSNGVCIGGLCYCTAFPYDTASCGVGVPFPQTLVGNTATPGCGSTCSGLLSATCGATGLWGPVDESGCGCPPPLADCDLLPGCETDTDTDLLNCGGCGNDCSNGVCIGGLCYCAAFPYDTTSCGLGVPFPQTLVGDTATPGCGSSCAGLLSATCGATGLWSPVDESSCGCPPPLADCDLLPGCETDTSTDPNNCGSCGNVCTSGFCAGGLCLCPALTYTVDGCGDVSLPESPASTSYNYNCPGGCPGQAGGLCLADGTWSTIHTCDHCGNSVCDGVLGEQCDGLTDWCGITSCADLGFSSSGGSLSCAANCTFDTSLCCTSNATVGCNGAEVWWFDSCGNPESLIETCVSGICLLGACQCPVDTHTNLTCGDTVFPQTDAGAPPLTPLCPGGCSGLLSRTCLAGGIWGPVTDTCACAVPMADCDGLPGCEVDISTDPSNCGGCGIDCGPNSACVMGGCACLPGFENCDGDWTNGCEVDIANDPNNCGSCGFVCAGGLCATSLCKCPATNYDTGICGLYAFPETFANVFYTGLACPGGCPGEVGGSCSAAGTWTFSDTCNACGNGTCDAVEGEACDGNFDFCGSTCVDFGFSSYGGSLSCNPDCTIDTNSCCLAHDSFDCAMGDVYWFNSCGDREEIKENCVAGCGAGICL